MNKEEMPKDMDGFALRAKTLSEAIKIAQLICNTNFVPKDYQGEWEKTLVAISMGREVGLYSLQALQNIAVINGRPTIWGDAMQALVLAHPACEYINEYFNEEGTAAFCTVKRKGHPEATYSFSINDAKKAQLWGKKGPWQTYPKRMLQMRARGFALRDKFADALKGLITAEEARDYPTETALHLKYVKTVEATKNSFGTKRAETENGATEIATITTLQFYELEDLISLYEVDEDKFKKYFGISEYSEMDVKSFDKAVAMIKKKPLKDVETPEELSPEEDPNGGKSETQDCE